MIHSSLRPWSSMTSFPVVTWCSSSPDLRTLSMHIAYTDLLSVVKCLVKFLLNAAGQWGYRSIYIYMDLCTLYTLYVFITQCSTLVKVNIDPLVCSDHSLISADIRTSETVKMIYDTRTISKRDWTRVDLKLSSNTCCHRCFSPIHQSTQTIFLSAMTNVFSRL